MTDLEKLNSLANKLRYPAMLEDCPCLAKFNSLVKLTPESTAGSYTKILQVLVDESQDLFRELSLLPQDLEKAKNFLSIQAMAGPSTVKNHLRKFGRSFKTLVDIYDRAI